MPKLNPKDVFISYKNKELSIDSILSYLESFIEESDDTQIRIESIQLLGDIEINNDKIFKILENCLISDEDSLVRASAAKLVAYKFPANKLFNFVIDNDSSALVITTIFRVLDDINDEMSMFLRKKIIEKYAKIHGVVLEEAKFILDLYGLATENRGEFGGDFEVNQEYINTHIRHCICDCIPRYYAPEVVPLFAINHNHIIALDIIFWELRELPNSLASLKKLRYLTFDSRKIDGEYYKELPYLFNSLRRLKWISTSFPYDENRPSFVPDWVFSIAKKYHAKTYIKEGVKKNEAYVLGLFDLLIGTNIYKLEDYDYLDHDLRILGYRKDEDGHVIGLYLSHYHAFKLKILPEQIGELKWLIDLDIHNNIIREVPDSIGSLTHLKYLNLSYNKIQKLPSSITSLRSLRFLSINGNNIDRLPNSIKNLISSQKYCGYFL